MKKYIFHRLFLITLTMGILMLESVTLNACGMFNGKKYTSVTFQGTDEVFVNPLMGYAPWVQSILADKMSASNFSLAFALLSWKELESEKGVYDFDSFESKIDLAFLEENNIKVIIRFVCDYPSGEKHTDIPEWLYEETADGIFYNSSQGRGYAPNYENELFIEYHQKVIAELGKRYDNSPNIAFIELGSLGNWGEWHNWLVEDKYFPGSETTDIYASHYLDAFKNKKLMMRRPYKISVRNSMGYYNDMMGVEYSTNQWLEWIRGYNADNYYNTAPSGGEFASSYPLTDYFGNMFPMVEQLTKNSHTTFIATLPPSGDEFKENVSSLLKSMGYRLKAKGAVYSNSVRENEDIEVTLCIQNIGSAAFYYDWKFCYLIFNAEGELAASFATDLDIRNIAVNTPLTHSVSIKISLLPGIYTIKAGLFNPYTYTEETQTADIMLANSGIGQDRLLTIGTVEVTQQK